ncbi:ribose 5-phosphate isomerase [Pontibacillus chungwhensis BH030062]|uniref:Ribose 5-phosphate isomerase A n=1 Tax=Pontibacillus chungwhensis BH030062 TaxID=1385513 RepID=A0A0A2UQP9_9BACI|nr:ribose 5-phosphate isomerase A [Pontibacillus chungwhensis]KGP90632.1 ribose 5-phosphate isomerase [Pontibacillus chungwhensis BH030062]
MDLKQKIAKRALDEIQEGMVVGLGGGSTIKQLVHFLKDSGCSVKVVTPSWETKQHCKGVGLDVVSIEDVSSIDIAFDGCDQVDENLCALKSGGGIHTAEKIVARLADEYVLLVDESKLVPTLTYEHSIVLEVLPQAMEVVLRQLERYPINYSEIRESEKKDGVVVTEFGNHLLDVYIKPRTDHAILENELKALTGVVEVSLFTSVITKAIVGSERGIWELT